jgi:SAM-dependent methyltransferase
LSAPRFFDQQHYDKLNAARGAVVTSLLSEVSAPLALKTAIDVGCGVGYFSGVLQSLGLDVQAVDGRQGNVDEAQCRFPAIPFRVCDAQDSALRALGQFDLVFCFGLLYHLENPLSTIRHLHAMTSKLLLVEGVIFPGEEPIMALVDEGPTEDQGLNHIAFYPTEACLVKMLYRAGFSDVYGFETPPDHGEYHVSAQLRRTRTMLAASLSPVHSRQLQRIAEVSTAVIPWDPESAVPEMPRLEKLRRLVSKSMSGKNL